MVLLQNKAPTLFCLTSSTTTCSYLEVASKTQRGMEQWKKRRPYGTLHLTFTNISEWNRHRARTKNLHMGLHKIAFKVAIKERVKQLICFSSIKIVFRGGGTSTGSWKKAGCGGQVWQVQEVWDPHCDSTDESCLMWLTSFSVKSAAIVWKKSVHSSSSMVEVFRQTWPHDNPRNRSSHTSQSCVLASFTWWVCMKESTWWKLPGWRCVCCRFVVRSTASSVMTTNLLACVVEQMITLGPNVARWY